MFETIDIGITERSKSAEEFTPKMADPPKATKNTLKCLMQSDPTFLSTSNHSTDESLGPNNSSRMKSRYSFLSAGTVSPARFSPASPYAMSPWSNASACPSPWTLMSPLHSPFLTPLMDGISYGCIATLVRKDGHVSALTMSGDGLLYTGSESNSIRVWKHPSLHEYGCLKAGSGFVKALLLVRDYVFSAHHDRKIRVWYRPRKNSRVCRRVGTLPTMKDQIQSSMNPKNYVQVRRSHGALWIKHTDAISSLAYNEEGGVLYSGSWDKTVKVWRMRDWKCVESIVAHDDAVSSIAVATDGLLFTGSADSTVKVWAPIPGKGKTKHVLAQTLTIQQSGAVNALVLSTDGAILYSGSADGAVNIWERRKPIYMNSTLQLAGFLKSHKHAVLCLATVKNLVFSGSADKTIQIWRRDPIGGFHSWLAVLQGHSGPVKSIAAAVDVSISHGFLVYSGSMDRSVKVWWVEDNDSSPNGNATYYSTNPVLSPAWVQQKLA